MIFLGFFLLHNQLEQSGSYPTAAFFAQECGHCHLCSAAELKARKKVETPVMLMGPVENRLIGESEVVDSE